MNPNYLTKDELSYELGIRGIVSCADTHNLRKLFRNNITRDLPLQYSYLTSGPIEGLYLCISTKVSELQNSVVQPGTNWSLLAPRVLTKIRHLKGRLQHLTDAGLCSTRSELSCAQELQLRLDQIEQRAAAMQRGDNTREVPSVHMGETLPGPSSTGSSLQTGDSYSMPNSGEV